MGDAVESCTVKPFSGFPVKSISDFSKGEGRDSRKLVFNFKSGISEFDKEYEGFYRWKSYYLFGQEKSCKTMFLTQLAVNAFKEGKKVLFVSIDDNRFELGCRISGFLTKTSPSSFLKNRVPSNIEELLKETISEAEEKWGCLDITMDNNLGGIVVWVAESLYDLVIIDGLTSTIWRDLRGGKSTVTVQKLREQCSVTFTINDSKSCLYVLSEIARLRDVTIISSFLSKSIENNSLFKFEDVLKYQEISRNVDYMMYIYQEDDCRVTRLKVLKSKFLKSRDLWVTVDIEKGQIT